MESLLDIGGALVAAHGESYADGLEDIPVPAEFLPWRLRRFFGANLRHACGRIARSL